MTLGTRSLETSDEVLISRAQAGDAEAFGRLVHRYERQVRSIVVGMLGQVTEADDVAQEVFIRFYRSLGQFRGEALLRTYLSRIAINLSLNELKRRQRRQRWMVFLHADNAPREMADRSAAPERIDQRDLLQRALGLLPADFRMVVTLRLIEGYSVQETAEILELPQGTVASRLARAQDKLRAILAEWGLNPVKDTMNP